MDTPVGALGPGRATVPGPVPYLSSWDGTGRQRRWPLRGPVVTVGRAAGVDVVVPDDPLVSRLHTRLELVAGSWTVLDEGLSRNGTFVNGRRITGRVVLHDRDELRVGTTVLRFCAPEEVVGPPTLVGMPLPALATVTAVQRRVLVALCRPCQDPGWAVPATNQQVAAELCLSVDAVKAHLRVLFHRFDLDHLPQNAKRVRLAELALRHGLVSRRELSSDLTPPAGPPAAW